MEQTKVYHIQIVLSMMNPKKNGGLGRIRTDTVMFLRHSTPAVGLRGREMVEKDGYEPPLVAF